MGAWGLSSSAMGVCDWAFGEKCLGLPGLGLKLFGIQRFRM